MRWTRWRIVAAVAGLAVMALLVAAAWFLQPQQLLPEATAALASTPTVEFSDAEGWLAYRPVGSTPTTGLIFYPGGKVEAAAYAPAAQAIAARGYATFVVPMPLNLAILGIDRALDVEAAHPEIEHWAIGGHSLGGAMAGQFLAGHPDAADGLFLWAAYSSGDVSEQAIEAVSIYGSLDNGAASFTSPDNLAKLPPTTPTVVIEGGNHEQMGYYTGQPNDPPATIPRDDQQAQAVEATVRLLDAISR
jgi:pimeloyl-ACP methyl ester carboxylesterase